MGPDPRSIRHSADVTFPRPRSDQVKLGGRRLLALFGRTERAQQCRLSAVKLPWRGHRKTVANNPYRTWNIDRLRRQPLTDIPQLRLKVQIWGESGHQLAATDELNS